MKGLITIEGCEGVGKSTQLQLLKNYCDKNNIKAVFTREPGGSIIAEKIRNIILDGKNTKMSDKCEALLYAASRNQHIHDIIIPALKNQNIVFCDRYIDSTFAYQGYGRELGMEYISMLNNLSVGEYIPEYTIFLDLEPRKAFLRKGGPDKKDRLENQDISFFDKVYAGYKKSIELNPQRFIIINAEKNKEEIFNSIIYNLREKGILE